MGSSCSSSVTVDGVESSNNAAPAGVPRGADFVPQHQNGANAGDSQSAQTPQVPIPVPAQPSDSGKATDDVVSTKESGVPSSRTQSEELASRPQNRESDRQSEQQQLSSDLQANEGDGRGRVEQEASAFQPEDREADDATSAALSLKLEGGSFTVNRLDSPQGDPFSEYEVDGCDERGRAEGISVSGLGSRSQSFDESSLAKPTAIRPDDLVGRRDGYDSEEEASEKDTIRDSDCAPLRQSWEDADGGVQSVTVTGVRVDDDKMAGIGQLAITKPAPEFETSAVVNGEFKQVKLSDYRGKYVVLFFYPLDFTFVCPTEIIAFSDRVEEFRAIQCEVMACSTDSVYSHLAWVDTPRKQGGLGPMKIPLLADKTLEISKKYGTLKEDEGVAFRGLFIIDDKGNLRQITINDLPVGRSVDETLRLVQAFQFTDKHGEVCPAGWKPGKETMKPSPKESQKYFNKVN